MLKSNTHDVESNVEEVISSNYDSTMIVNSIKASTVNLGDIWKLMSTSNKGKHQSLTTKVANKYEILIDVKTYREVNKLITYSLSHTTRFLLYSLVNRGANGDISGNDVRITFKDPSKTLNVIGIDNH